MFAGYLFLAGLVWLFLFAGGKKKEQSSSPAITKPHESYDDLERFVELLQSGWSGVSKKVEKVRLPVFATALFVFLRNENSNRSKMSISEFMEYIESDFEKSNLCDLARVAASQGLLEFDGSIVDLKDAPTLKKLLQKLFR
ncbi:hypothetical protein SAMN03159341_11738 [Paenibacillus sp. 1_12]|uniref:hypothetical protein n=1 Tax=Paenibacillus sp. 1_12 TaxID=1566278 RepID=UPI0008E22079|nr:hypothetical protein [Paenibacillus sp. 1_12]SFM12301.1 hypothetical protein SAMN03159341_11738 [Paenibacillus sp. 1_12]